MQLKKQLESCDMVERALVWKSFISCMTLSKSSDLPGGLSFQYGLIIPHGRPTWGPHGCMPPRMAMNAAQHKIVNLLKTFFFWSSVFKSVCVFNVWPRDAKRLDTPGRAFFSSERSGLTQTK